MSRCFRLLRTSLLALALLTARTQPAAADPQAFHIVDINEVYSNADGTRQFVELISGSIGQNQLAATWLIALNSDGTDTNIVFDFTAAFLPGFNTNETILLATAGLQSDLGITADFTIPDNSLFLGSGRVIFEDPPPFPQMVDAVAYGAYTGSNTNFGSPTAALPSNGCASLRRNTQDFTLPKDNALQWGIAANATPRAHDGSTATITCPPIAPVLAAIGGQATDETLLLTFGVNASDGNGDIITLSAENLPAGANFINHGNGTGTFTWTPTCLQSGSYVGVLFIASDGGLADSESVTITVNELSDPAVARDSVAIAVEDVALSANLQGFDPDNDPVTYTIISGPLFGQATGLNPLTGAFTYQGNLNQFSGPPDLIMFTITDNNCAADTGRWDVTITPVNDAPVADDHSDGTTPNTLLAVGQIPASDVDNGSLSFSHIDGPFHGSVSNLDAADGSFDYLPDLDYEGGDTVIYVVSDGDLADTARVFITIESGCFCNCHADPVCDATTNVQDVVSVLNVAFRGGADTVDPQCSHVGRADLNCDCVVSVVDVVNIVNHAFRGDATPFCNPCSTPCP